MKFVKFLTVASALSLVLSAAAFAEGDTTAETSYTDFEADLVLEMTANEEYEGKYDFSWSQYTGENFQYYKLVTSQENAEPVYPGDHAVFVGDDVATTAANMIYPDEGTNYYSLCVITSDMMRACSNAVMVEGVAKTEEEKESTGGDYTDFEVDLVLESTPNADYEGKFDFSWDQYAGDNFQYYKLVMSQEDSAPTYPEDHAVFVGDDVAMTSKDAVYAKPGMNYFRLCVVTSDMMRGCSNTIALEGPEKSDETKTEDTKAAAFTDVEGHWAQDYVTKLKVKGVVEGKTDGSFDPDAPVTRAEALKMMLVAAGYAGEECDTGAFTDLSADAWYCKIATKAKMKGWVEGENGALNPNRDMNRAEVVKVLLMVKGLETVEVTEAPFPDVPVSEWYAAYVYKAKMKGYVSGKEDGTYDPDAPVTRAELSKMLVKAMGY